MGDRSSDADLVHAAVAGDRRAFSELFERWFDRSFDVAWNIVRDRESAAEVAQEVFLAAWTGLGTLRDPDAFGGWILRTSRNKALNRLERERRSRPTDVDVAVDLADRRRHAVDVAEDIVRDEQHELLWAAATALGEADASILDLHLRHDLDAAQIAEILEVEPNAAHQRLFRLRKRLEGAIRSHVIWNGGEPRCDELTALLADAGLEAFGPPVVKLVSRHVPDCDGCDERQRAILAPASMFGAVPLVVVGSGTRRAAAASLAESGVVIDPHRFGTDEVGAAAGGSPGRGRSLRRVLAVAAGATVLAVGALAVSSMGAGGGGPAEVADAAGSQAPASDDPASIGSRSVATAAHGSTTPPPAVSVPETPPAQPDPTTTGPTPSPPGPPPDPPPPPDEPTTTAPGPVVVRFDAVVGGPVACSGRDGLELHLVWVTDHAEEVTLGGPGVDPGAVHPGSGSLDSCLARGERPEWTLDASGAGGTATAETRGEQPRGDQ